jgi:hypothetical protein
MKQQKYETPEQQLYSRSSKTLQYDYSRISDTEDEQTFVIFKSFLYNLFFQCIDTPFTQNNLPFAQLKGRSKWWRA